MVWNATFKQFADYWGFEPHLCRAYRAQTKGKVESGVKYFKRNFLPGRTFVDEQDLREQLGQWQAEIADVRMHGTTHERPADRFARERPHLIATTGQPGFRLEASQPRRVAEDYLVSFETNRYSVPFTLIGQTVEVTRRGSRLHMAHGGHLVAEHDEHLRAHHGAPRQAPRGQREGRQRGDRASSTTPGRRGTSRASPPSNGRSSPATAHSLFWQNLIPRGEPTPTGGLAEQIDRDFGSFDTFTREFATAAATIMA